MMLKQFVRGFQVVSRNGPQQMRMVQSMNQLYMNQQMAIVNQQQRFFAKKKKGGKKGGDDATATEDEGEPTIAETIANLREETQQVAPPVEKPTPPPPKAKPTMKAGGSFSVGDVQVIQTVPDHKPPSSEDTIEGRYAGVLFTTASQQEALFSIYEDMAYLREIYESSETFRLFTQNGGVGKIEITKFNAALQEVADFHPTTIRFLGILAENKRLVFINEIAKRYTRLYQQFHKEEKITIISASKLTSSEEGEVLAALQANPQNTGKQFQLEFTIDESIKGGLQMYTETEFMDMSLSSRLTRLNQEMNKLTE